MNEDPTVHSFGDPEPRPHQPSPELVAGARLGPYTLREPIGTGGMGEVWTADQSAPIRRTVALKLIKAGMDTREVLTRFEAERQALALMDHPSIARVYDAGTTPQGRPYFAMEYVQGIPITDYCDQRRLDTRARLELFQKVCHAIQHAHQKSVVHRDLKPSNILVADVDAKPLPKVIDFGVAKATTRKLTERTMHTSLGQMIGTPEYMSPEQAEMTQEDVDTRTDVYSLGVVLYELLVGALPFEGEQLRKGGLADMLRILREEEPPRPSERLSSLGDRATTVSNSRRTESKRLSSQIRGDLDWIVMRALEKDRNRRYGSPAEFAQDVQRHLDDQPVVAGPPTAGYRAAKFVRRHRAGVTVTTAAVLTLVAFTLVTAVQARTIARERDRATAEADKAAAMNDFLARTIASADPWAGGGREVTVAEALDSAAEEVGRAFADQPATEASLRTVLGEAFYGLGHPARARAEIEAALRTFDELGDADARPIVTAYLLRSRIARESGEFDDAIEAGTTAVRISADDATIPLYDRVNAHQYLARGYMFAQRFAEADSVLSLAEGLARNLDGEDRILVAENLSQRADLAIYRDGDAAAADSLTRAAFDHLSAIDPRSAHLATYLNNAAQYRSQLGDLEGALADFDRALELNEQVFGTDHPAYATCVENRGGVLYRLGRADETLAALELTYEIRERNLGPDHIDVLRTRINVGTVAMLTKDNERALEVFAALKPRLIEARGGTDHPDVLTVTRNQAIALRGLGRHAESLLLFEQTVDQNRRVYGPDDPRVALALADAGEALVSLERWDEARTRIETAFEIFREKHGAQDPRTMRAADTLVALGERTGDTATVERYRPFASSSTDD